MSRTTESDSPLHIEQMKLIEAATSWITVRLWLFTIYSHFQTRCRPTYLYISGLCVYTTAGIWTVKYNTQNAPENGAPFRDVKFKKNSGGYAPSPNPSPRWGGRHPLPTPHPPHPPLRLRRLNCRAFGATDFAHPT